MNEAVDRVIEQREAMDRGLSGGFALSAVVHALVIAGALGAAWLGPPKPRLNVVQGFVGLPPGGGGPTGGGEPARTAPPVTAPPSTEAPAPAPAPPPKVLKPPKEEKQGL